MSAIEITVDTMLSPSRDKMVLVVAKSDGSPLPLRGVCKAVVMNLTQMLETNNVTSAEELKEIGIYKENSNLILP